MKFVRIFAVFFAINLIAWVATHFYLHQNKSRVLLVVDTSYAMKENFVDVKKWIENYESQSRYKTITVGTDKAILGDLADLSSREVIFRTAFGKLQAENLVRLYSDDRSDKRILLSDGSLLPDNWDVVEFRKASR